MAAPSAAGASIAQKQWELENNVQTIPSVDEIYKYNHSANQAVLNAKPWSKDPHYFKSVKMSALALLKMTMHARSGGTLEVMGLMQGKVDGTTMIVMDAFALPVEGTETRVTAAAEAYEYMPVYLGTNQQVGKLENVLGWYHSHPGYGCWLSGIDVNTQMQNQQFTDPFLAVVVDPTRTISAGKVEIGAFRTYPAGYKPPEAGPSEYQSVPLSKIEDFGVHANSYYPLEITYFKSATDSHLLDLLWNKYWVSTLSSSPLLANREYATGQLADIAEKLERAEVEIAHGRGGAGVWAGMATPGAERSSSSSSKKEESQLSKISRDCCKMGVEQIHGILSEVLKDCLFNVPAPVAAAAVPVAEPIVEDSPPAIPKEEVAPAGDAMAD